MIIAKQTGDLHTSRLSQAIVARALSAPWYPEHLNAVRRLYRTKRDALMQVLAEQFGDRLTFAAPRGGMFVWAQLHNDVTSSAESDTDSARWLSRALDHNVCFVPGQAFAVDRDLSSFVRLSYATGTTEELAEGVRRMALALG